MPNTPPSQGRRWPAVLVWAAIAAALLLVAQAYLSPHLVVDLANLVWSCF
ncbi:MAG: hypothetical protein U5L74_00415 [Ideonella sp.]|nr:hypothetical protein [Ideonella sp.]